MSDLLSDKKIKQLCVKYLAWDEPVSNRDLELIKPLFKAQNAKTKKGQVERLKECGRESLDYYSPDKPVKEWCIPWEDWQKVLKEVEDG